MSAAASTATDDERDDPEQQQSERHLAPPQSRNRKPRNREHENTGQHAEGKQAGTGRTDRCDLMGTRCADRDRDRDRIGVGDVAGSGRASRL